MSLETQQRRDRAMGELPDPAAMRSLAAGIRDHTLAHLDLYLDRFMRASRANGVEVHLAETAADARRVIATITSAAALADPTADPPSAFTANFLVADSGAMLVLRDDALPDTALATARTLIGVAGIDRLLPRSADLAVMLKLFARSGSGRTLSARTHLLTGPRRGAVGHGPDRVHVVLIDDGRVRSLANKTDRELLRCIRCGGCLEVAGVGPGRGVLAADGFDPTPEDAVLTPLADAIVRSGEAGADLTRRCNDVCPVRIDLASQVASHRARRPTPAAPWWRRAIASVVGPRRDRTPADLPARLRAALGHAGPASPPDPPSLPEPITRLVHSDFGLPELFVSRAHAVGTQASLVRPEELIEPLAAALHRRGARTVGFTRNGLLERLDVPAELRKQGFTLVAADTLAAAELEGLDAALTDASFAVAETGSIGFCESAPISPALALAPATVVAILEPRNMLADLVDWIDTLGPTTPATLLLSGSPPSPAAPAESPGGSNASRQVLAFVLH